MTRFSNYHYYAMSTRDPENLDPNHPKYVGKQYVQQLFTSGRMAELAGSSLDPQSSCVLVRQSSDDWDCQTWHKSADQPGMLQLLQHAGFTNPDTGPGHVRYEKVLVMVNFKLQTSKLHNMLRRLIATTLLLGFTITAQAQTQPEVLRLWPGDAPEAKGSEAGDIPVIHLYRVDSKQPTAGVVICPGGGYGHLAMDHEGKQFAEWLTRWASLLRFVCIVIAAMEGTGAKGTVIQRHCSTHSAPFARSRPMRTSGI